MKNIFFTGHPIYQSQAIGIVRIIVGIFMIYHGWEVFSPTKMAEYAAWDSFKNTGVANFLVYLGKGAELVGGVFLTIGLFTRISCLILGGTMLYVAFILGNGKIWYEDQYPFLFVLLAFLLFFTGPGSWSIDKTSRTKKDSF
ncbi:MAG: DoxX family protein [Chitinophagaceae bacterium]|nr:DoxX family protein [Chitinophagaceae bacterium]